MQDLEQSGDFDATSDIEKYAIDTVCTSSHLKYTNVTT